MGKRITAAYPIAKAGGIPINTSIPASKETYDRLGGRDVAFVVLHYTGNVSDTAEANCKYFAGGDREASAHYFVDEDSIYQSVPACDRAWAVGSPDPVHPLAAILAQKHPLLPPRRLDLRIHRGRLSSAPGTRPPWPAEPFHSCARSAPPALPCCPPAPPEADTCPSSRSDIPAFLPSPPWLIAPALALLVPQGPGLAPARDLCVIAVPHPVRPGHSVPAIPASAPVLQASTSSLISPAAPAAA